MFKFVHAADIHLDSPMRGLERYEGAPTEEIRRATRRALESLVALAVAEKVAFVVVAGDLYDGDWHDFNTGLFLASQMSRLQKAGIRVFIASGNHDAASQITRSLRMPENVHFLAVEAPETVELDELAVALHGQGYASRAVRSNLAIGFPPAREGRFNIGVLHTSLGGYAAHEPYAPCSLDALLARDYDDWALGHVHSREVLHEGRPYVLFSGNAQGRHIGEAGEKGCTVVTVADVGTVTCEHRALDAVRWASLQLDVSGVEDAPAVVERAREEVEAALGSADGRLLAARITVSGSCSAHRELTSAPERWVNEVRAAVTDLSGGRAWVEKVRFQTSPEVDEEELRRGEGPIADLLRYFDEVGDEDDSLKDLAGELRDLQAKLAPSLSGVDELNLGSVGTIRELLDEARRMLLVRLTEEGNS